MSRPGDRDGPDPQIGSGRANNLLRLVYDIPTAEDERVAQTTPGHVARDEAIRALDRMVAPAPPPAMSLEALRARMDPADTVILACGNPGSTADIRATARRVGVEAVVEAW